MLLSHGNFRHLRLVPLLSGYRDNERKKVTLTDSHPAHDGSSKSRSLIEIPYDQIVSLQLVNASFLFQNAVMDEDFLGSIARAA
jgi:hypothetical protein